MGTLAAAIGGTAGNLVMGLGRSAVEGPARNWKVSVMDQIAFAKFLTSGGYDRHLRQMRRRYLTRRNALLRALTRYVPEATVLGAAAGVHLTVRFPDGYPDRGAS